MKIFLLNLTLMISLGSCAKKKPQPNMTEPLCHSPPCHVRNIRAKVYLTDELPVRVEKYLRRRNESKDLREEIIERLGRYWLDCTNH